MKEKTKNQLMNLNLKELNELEDFLYYYRKKVITIIEFKILDK